ncbi:MAG: hypothetical protein HQK51_17280 [Oligoflexia bacterium]|nr:hypothetical protein [Oligoflexia bacterium]
MNEINIYIDASFNKTYQKGVAGFFIFTTTSSHQNNDIYSAINEMNVIHEINNIRMELISFILALEYFNKMEKVNRDNLVLNVFTDCQNIHSLTKRRMTLETTNFISKGSGKILSNADLYKTIYSLCDLLQPQIILVKGHSPSRDKDENFILKNFSLLDKMVRHKLRNIINK